ncbi:HAMP domain-containing sensor histidine kinase [uncultured Lutibacter sp.]|uniref:sensor histidine kinase n=1 Tax=uncultured Lutibacter sp. TaxID=437739 RepID=UPI00260B5D64|nr:HAMP domain-containing sensor histidine kinase [uncultured Lutibacter sp.]
MKKENNSSKEYINDLEDKILDLSIKLKNSVTNQKKENEANERLISKFLHNIKNPVGVAYSFSDMILSSKNYDDSEKLKKHVEIINDSTKFSIKLLNDFAVFRTVKSSEFKLDLKKCDYVKIVNEVIENCKEKAIKQGVSIKKQYLNNKLYVEVDEKYLKIALKEIIENAIRFSQANAIITINIVSNNGKIETTIFDEGVGISSENIKAVFDPFFVVNTYSLQKEKCVGLGLSVAKNIVNLHNGEISIQSELGQGTNVKLVLNS